MIIREIEWLRTEVERLRELVEQAEVDTERKVYAKLRAKIEEQAAEVERLRKVEATLRERTWESCADPCSDGCCDLIDKALA